jgi:hypothetical protein
MKLEDAAERILLGEPIAMLAETYREALLADFGMDPETEPDAFRSETRRFVNTLCRHLGERHAGDARVSMTLQEWVRGGATDYEAYDALLSGFWFECKERMIARGRQLFPGPLTAHWRA